VVAALLLLRRTVRGCGWFNAVLGGQQLTNAEEEEEEGELEDEDGLLCYSTAGYFPIKGRIVQSDATVLKLDIFGEPR